MMYEERVLAYIDILGFSTAIKETAKDSLKTEKIFHILKDINEFKNKVNNNSSIISSRIVSCFSDCVAVSYSKEEKAGVFHILSDILFLNCDILQKGFLFRGAITCGKLFHKQEKIFGPAMIAAVSMEEKLAVYPRIILEDKILAIAKEHPAEYPCEEEQLRVIKNKLISKDFDGLYYVNYFNGIDYIIGQDYGILTYFMPLREIINDLQEKADKDISIKSKYLWLKNKYNEVLRKYKKKYNNIKTQNEFPNSYNYIKDIEEIAEQSGESL